MRHPKSNWVHRERTTSSVGNGKHHRTGERRRFKGSVHRHSPLCLSTQERKGTEADEGGGGAMVYWEGELPPGLGGIAKRQETEEEKYPLEVQWEKISQKWGTEELFS